MIRITHKSHESEVIDIKTTFEAIVRENAAWLVAFVRRRVGESFAEDLAQEIWIRAFRGYGSFVDCGFGARPWLARIARNHIASRMSGRTEPLTLDDGLSEILEGDTSPEESYLERELVESVLKVIGTLPEPQREVLSLRYLKELTVEETAKALEIPIGSVKSRTYYALAAVRRAMGINEKENITMTCREAYKFLYVHAKNQLTGEKKAALEAHLASCESCRKVASALAKLVPTMTFAREDEQSHFSISFPELGLSYIGSTVFMKNHAKINEILRANSGNVPDDMWIYNTGYSGSTENHLAEFDSEGREIGVELIQNGGMVRVRQTHMESVAPSQWFISAMLYEDEHPCGSVEQSVEAPSLYVGKLHNYFGCAVKSALYQAISSDATNIRIRRGNGVVDCGTYSFAYVDRYVAADEGIALEYTFNR